MYHNSNKKDYYSEDKKEQKDYNDSLNSLFAKQKRREKYQKKKNKKYENKSWKTF